MSPVSSSANENVERIRALRSKTRASVSAIMAGVKSGYFGTTKDRQIDAEIDDMLDDIVEKVDALSAPPGEAGHLGRQAEGYILMGIGASGTRKTSSFRRNIEKRPEFAGYSEQPDLNESLIVSVTAPSPCTLRLLGISVAAAMGYSPRPTIEENAVWQLVRHNLSHRGLRILHIDEAQHVTQSKNVNEIKKIQDTLKSLVQSPTWPLWLILTGLPEITRVIEGDTQVWRRARFVRFEDMTFSRDAKLCRRMVEFFAGEKAKLNANPVLIDENVHRLMYSALFRLGIAIEMVQDAIHLALKSGSSDLLLEHFAQTFQKRTGCNTDENVFLVNDFTSIDVGRYFTRLLDDEEAEGLSPVKRARRNAK